jgi:hypothetical protein
MTTTQFEPTTGRIVHFVNSEGKHQAAIITDIPTDQEMSDIAHIANKDRQPVFLVVFARPGSDAPLLYNPVPYDEGMAHGTWHWPEPARPITGFTFEQADQEDANAASTGEETDDVSNQESDTVDQESSEKRASWGKPGQ